MMDRCVGFNANLDVMAKGLPCMPASVVYGHVASRGLDVNRWSFGLDTGCVSRIRVPQNVFLATNAPLRRFTVGS